ncbi:Protein of unknown function [Pyronema omphalodes CBS 100304]|uniref:Uncharacterized protein n=1 Tax=Pyronema omphalodes (strain CBS 100304) TaxID=1076935 RepID=U4LRC8_PYROM|nr:Protein of unknown function [Pyronema omphalodes CBS 100304]
MTSSELHRIASQLCHDHILARSQLHRIALELRRDHTIPRLFLYETHQYLALIPDFETAQELHDYLLRLFGAQWHRSLIGIQAMERYPYWSLRRVRRARLMSAARSIGDSW